MSPEMNAPTISRSPGFFREGWRELGRKRERNRLRKQLKGQDRERHEALTRIGQRAWQEKIDLSAFPDLREQLGRLEDQAGELRTAVKSLDREKATLDERRAAEVAAFDSQRRAVEDKKQPVDAALRSARDRLSERQHILQRLEARATAVSGELAALEQQLAALAATAAPEQQAQLAAARAKQQALSAEKERLSSELPGAQADLPGLAAELSRLNAESQRYAEEIGRIETARQAALAPIDTALERVCAQLRGSQQQAATVEQERGRRFAALGLVLYEQKAAAATLAEAMQQVAAIDQGRAATQAALRASLDQSQAMPGGTMLKFSLVMLLVPGVMFAGAGAYSGWNRLQPFLGGNRLQPSTGGERREGSVSRARKAACEPLRAACDRLRRWKDCAESNLANIPVDVSNAQGQLQGEFAARSSPPEQRALWEPQYIQLNQQLPELMSYVVTLRAEVAASAAQAQGDCALLPGPENRKECEEAARRVDEGLNKARDKLAQDLDGPKMAVFKSVLQAQGAAWPSMVGLAARLQVHQMLIQQCAQ